MCLLSNDYLPIGVFNSVSMHITIDHKEYQLNGIPLENGQGSVSSRVSAISVSLGVVSLGIFGLSVLLVFAFGLRPVLIALIMQMGGLS